MRVSKADGSQATDLQRDALLEAGVEPEALYEDKASGKSDDRPHLAACLKALRAGDTLLVWKLDRLGRDLRHLVNIVCQGPLSSAHRRPVFLPAGGHQNCPLVASWFARLGGGAGHRDGISSVA